MLEWILQRPAHACNASEIRVAEKLKVLADSPYTWTVIWGFYYRDGKGTEREGDFLVIGPAGGALVLEVKSTLPRHFSETGRWEGEEKDDPIKQMHDEWQGVISAVRKQGDAPFIEKSLCVPGCEAPTGVAFHQGCPRQWLVAGNDLENWIGTWIRIFGERVQYKVTADQRRSIIDALGHGALPEQKAAFIDHTEEYFRRQFTARFALLDQVSENRQLLVRGGTGTGKTWHALEQAFRYADKDGGRSVLFLTYNKVLTASLKRIVALRRVDRGEVIVRGWEELFSELAAAGGRVLEAPAAAADGRNQAAYYERDLPRMVLEAFRDPVRSSHWPAYDCLVVDEGQDHDTRWHPEIAVDPDERGGWWMVYQKLLAGGREAEASVFHDPAQRPQFRSADLFDPAELARAWSQPAHVRLQPAVRYTRPLWSFFRENSHPCTADMIGALGGGDHLPEGPVPEVTALEPGGDACAEIARIVTDWRSRGLCEPHEILILHAQSDVRRSPLGRQRVIAAHNLRECLEEEDAPNTIRHTSIHKAKGLDAKAVILIGMPARAALATDYEQHSWFMGVSRARQLLAVVESPAPDGNGR